MLKKAFVLSLWNPWRRLIRQGTPGKGGSGGKKYRGVHVENGARQRSETVPGNLEEILEAKDGGIGCEFCGKWTGKLLAARVFNLFTGGRDQAA